MGLKAFLLIVKVEQWLSLPYLSGFVAPEPMFLGTLYQQEGLQFFVGFGRCVSEGNKLYFCNIDLLI